MSTSDDRRSVVLVVDDVAMNRELLRSRLAELGHRVIEARDGVEALELVADAEPDLILLDVEMPRLDGLAVCSKLKAHPTRRLIPVVILTAYQDRETRLAGLAAGADDFLTKPFDAQELLVRSRVLLRERALNVRLDATEGVLLAFARAVEARDLYTIHHAERVGLYAREIGTALGYAESAAQTLYEGGVMHDLGKIAVPDTILLKPGPLDEEEYAIMQRHSVEGERIVLPLRSVRQFLPIIRHHHERIDGRGYPDHLAGSAIPAGARIVAIADAWDAMVSDRPYRAGLGADEARARLQQGAATQWDGDYTHIFLQLLEDGLAGRVEVQQLHQRIREAGAGSAVAASPRAVE